VTRNEIILGVVALVLIAFSLVVALVVPRRNPGFPGRHLRLFVVVAALLVAAMLAAVEVFGAEHENESGQEATATETTGGETETGGETATGPTETGGQVQGDPAAGKEVFESVQPSCGSCHTLEAAGSTQTLGPNLDEGLADKDAAFIRESIVNPDADVTEGFPDNLMPEDYGDKLSDQELADLVAFLVQSTSGS
jgi:mono/diheme cytochrome c family protein